MDWQEENRVACKGPRGLSAVVSLEDMVFVSHIKETGPLRVRDIRFGRGTSELDPKDVDARIMSEVLRDVEMLRP